MDSKNEKFVDAVFAHLLETGAIVLKGMNPQGEPVYTITEKCKEIFPEFYEIHMQGVNVIAYDLWEKGVVEIVFGEEGERVVFNENNYMKLEEIKNELSFEQVEFLQALGVPVEYNFIENED